MTPAIRGCQGHPYFSALLLASPHWPCSGSPSRHLPRWQTAAQDVWAPQKVSGWRCSVPQSFYSDLRLCPTLWDSSWSWMALPSIPCGPVTGDDKTDVSHLLSAVGLMDAVSSLEYDLEMRWGNGFLSALTLHTWRIHKEYLIAQLITLALFLKWLALQVPELCYRTLQFCICLPHTYPVGVFYIEHRPSSICLPLPLSLVPFVTIESYFEFHVICTYTTLCVYINLWRKWENIYTFVFLQLD